MIGDLDVGPSPSKEMAVSPAVPFAKHTSLHGRLEAKRRVENLIYISHFVFGLQEVTSCRDGLVGYDAALTRLRSGVQLPLLVLYLLLLHHALMSIISAESS